MMTDASAQQEEEWSRLYNLITQMLTPLGADDGLGRGDYWLLDDNYGWYRHQLEFQNPRLFHPDVVKSLQTLLVNFPDWDITISLHETIRQIVESWRTRLGSPLI